MICLMLIVPGLNADTKDAAEKNQQQATPKLYIEGYYEIDYIRTEIPYMTYVRDRKDSDIHLQIMSISTGSGGTEYTLYFFGRNQFDKDDRVIKYICKSDDTYEIRRAGLVNTIKVGLVNYLAKTDLAQNLLISFKKDVKVKEIKDKWDKWMFTTAFNTSMSGDENYKSSSMFGFLRAKRVTEKLKINASLMYSISRHKYVLGGETYTNDQTIWGFDSRIVKSLGEHWSAGGHLGMESSTYSNRESSYKIAAALEYNIFPYAQATKKQFVFNYTLGQKFSKYRKLTIYDQIKEARLYHNLIMVYKQQTKWGSFFGSLSASQYFFDLSKNQIQFRASFSVNLFKGFRFHVFSKYSIIHDQLSIQKGDTTTEEILLKQKELASAYDYSLTTGFSYSFGSIYNNVVNPRFEQW
jgi:hypothetical protein